MKSFFETYFNRPLRKIFHIFESQTESIKLGTPSKGLKIIAVTGTSGKSSTSSMIYHILKENGFRTGIISTVGAIAGDKKIDTGLHVTTPDPKQLQQILKKMKEENIEYVVLETSSHSIAQGRLGLLSIDYAVFTNIKSDHLDWHGNWNNYAKAKAGLINKLKIDGKLILNRDDEVSYNFLRHYYYSKAKNALNFIEYSKLNEVKNISQKISGLTFEYRDNKFEVPIIGEYNIENLLAAIKLAESLNINVSDISNTLSTFEGIQGRMEIMQKEPFMVIVDFAHNADSLEKSLKSIRKVEGVNRIISVFGSAGLRDVKKRFDMGKIAAELSEVVIITSEDPRIEKLSDINSKILDGAKAANANLVKRIATHEDYINYIAEESNTTNISDKSVFIFDQETVDSRFDAIDFAVKIAQPGDIVITEGKGHEQSLCFGTTEYPFTDQVAVKRALEKH